eukprot:SAG31_NODE_2867_length_4979_cov_2.330123_7_plen_146_part_00
MPGSGADAEDDGADDDGGAAVDAKAEARERQSLAASSGLAARLEAAFAEADRLDGSAGGDAQGAAGRGSSVPVAPSTAHSTGGPAAAMAGSGLGDLDDDFNMMIDAPIEIDIEDAFFEPPKSSATAAEADTASARSAAQAEEEFF